MTADGWEELRGLTLARQFPDLAGHDVDPDGVTRMVGLMGPIQSQTARSPYAALGARLPGVTHDAVTAAYESHAIVRGSSIRGTVHTSTAAHHALLDATTRVTQQALWVRQLGLERAEVDELWQATEGFAAEAWRTPGELLGHLHDWLGRRGRAVPERLDGGISRYLAFGHGGLLRRPLTGAWSGQGAPGYRSAATVLRGRATPDDPLLEVVRLHLASYGPSSRRDVAWWSGLGLRQVDELLGRLDLVWRDGPDGLAYADVPGAPAPRELPGVRLLPEFDAVLCGYDPKARDRFVSPADNARLWNKSNGFMLAPLLVDGRIGGHWRIEGSGRRRSLEVMSFPGSRRPRRTELDAPVSALTAALDLPLASVTVARG